MIGGNIKAVLQVSTTTKNEIGEKVPVWHDVVELLGWLDYRGGEAKYTTYNAKIDESTHLFICDYLPIPATLEVDGKTVRVSAENARIATLTQKYDVVMMDNPMGLNAQWEIYLKHTGGQ